MDTPQLFLLTGQRHPIACLSHLGLMGTVALRRAFDTLVVDHGDMFIQSKVIRVVMLELGGNSALIRSMAQTFSDHGGGTCPSTMCRAS